MDEVGSSLLDKSSAVTKRPEDQSTKEWMSEYSRNEWKGNQKPADRQSKNADDFAVDAELLDSYPLITDGTYFVKYQSHETAMMRGEGKLIVHFTICNGPFCGTNLKAFYRVSLVGKTGKFGKFQVSRIGYYYEQMCELFPEIIGNRTDRLSPRRLRGKIVAAEVSTVKQKWDGEARKSHVQYSKVSKMLHLVQDN